MEKLFKSVPLVRKIEDSRTFWLLRWQPAKACWCFAIGERLGDESFRETAIREVAWQLNLQRDQDYLVSNVPQLSMEYLEELPDEHSQRHIYLAFYCVDIYRKGVLSRIDADQNNCWVSSAELCAGKTAGGESIQPKVVEWIRKWRIIQPWES